MKFMLVFTMFFLSKTGVAQVCTAKGQNPANAYPLCGSSGYTQGSVPVCQYLNLNIPNCTGANYNFTNPFWFKFTCYTAGTLGFIINPNGPNEDYNWQLYDITGHLPEELFTLPGLIVTGNWSGTYGPTGASASGVNYIQCITQPQENAPTFARMPYLYAGHNYILLVSHIEPIQSGYTLTLNGGTADIVNAQDPHVRDSAISSCDGLSAYIFLNKKLLCSTVSGNGSEFTLSPPLANVIAATGVKCTDKFDMDLVKIIFSTPLPAGNYIVSIQNGTDGNTLLDECGKMVPVGETAPMVVYPRFPTPMDSILKPACAPDRLQLFFRTPIKCVSIAPDGSDFVVTGPNPVTVISAAGINCSDSGALIINVQLSAPISTRGLYHIKLVTGNDGNGIIDLCSQETPVGSTLDFVIKDTVNASFTYNVNYGCLLDTAAFFHDGRGEVNSWKWSLDNGITSTLQNPVVFYNTFGQKYIRLTVSNGVCSATSARVPIYLDNALKAGFEATSLVCPGDPAFFKDTSIGRIASWEWSFGNGSSSILQSPPSQFYTAPRVTETVIAKLTVHSIFGCKSDATQKILLPGSCYIAVPGAFTPNEDGINDYLYPLNGYRAKDLLFMVYNRAGQLMFETRDWTVKWDGRYKGQPADPGVYVWILHYTSVDTGKYVEEKGASILVR